jgi:multisubunit Na+/H+ antiporter MnhE subunit
VYRPSRQVHQQPVRRVAGIVFWWLVLCGVWLLYVGQHTKENAVAGAIAAAVAVGFAAFLARLGLYRLEIHPRRLHGAAALPWFVLRDFGVVTLALLHGRPTGRLVELDLPAGSLGDRALLGLLGSVAPNAYLVDFDTHRRRALVHELDPSRSRGALL